MLRCYLCTLFAHDSALGLLNPQKNAFGHINYGQVSFEQNNVSESVIATPLHEVLKR